MQLKTFAPILLTSALLGMSGCASIISESRSPVWITSSPTGADYQITNEDGERVHSGVTPAQVTLKAGAGYFDGETYNITFKKDGYAEKTNVLDTSLNGWYWGNLLFGGLLGMLIVDPITGAMYKLPERTSASLTSIPTPYKPDAPLPAAAAQTKSKEQQLNELAEDKSLTYEEYKRRYNIIQREIP